MEFFSSWDLSGSGSFHQKEQEWEWGCKNT